MRREGCDPTNVQMSDVLCDFCSREWTDARPMVEGHQGSCICGDCLAAAYRAIVLQPPPAVSAPARACRRCVRQSAAVLAKDPDLGWRKPEAGPSQPAVP